MTIILPLILAFFCCASLVANAVLILVVIGGRRVCVRLRREVARLEDEIAGAKFWHKMEIDCLQSFVNDERRERGESEITVLTGGRIH